MRRMGEIKLNLCFWTSRVVFQMPRKSISCHSECLAVTNRRKCLLQRNWNPLFDLLPDPPKPAVENPNKHSDLQCSYLFNGMNITIFFARRLTVRINTK